MRTSFCAIVVILSIVVLSACRAPQPKPVTVIAKPSPVQPEQQAAPEPTLLEKYQEMTRLYDADHALAEALAVQLAEQTKARQTAESQLATAASELESARQRLSSYDGLQTKYEEVQRIALDLETSNRQLRKDLLEARLLMTKSEQTTLALKIEQAMERRRMAVETHGATDETQTETE